MKADEELILQKEAAKGQRAKAILACSGWIQDVEPYLTDRIAALAKGSSWHPGGSTDTGAVLLGCSYNGGREDECLNLRTQLNIWVEQGRIAQEKLDKANKEQK